MTEKRVAVRFASQGGDALKAEMRGIGLAGREAMAELGSATAPAEQRIENLSAAALKARIDLENMATRAASEAARMRTTIPATSDVQAQVMRSTGVTNESGQSAAEALRYGQALDDMRAKINPLYAEIRRYRNALSEVRAAELEGAISADEAAQAKTRLRQASLRAIDGIRGITAANREAARAAEEAARAAERQAREMSDLRARYNPIYAEIRRYRTALQEVRDAEQAGAISADEAAQAKSRLRQASLQALDGIRGLTAANRESARAAEEAARAAQREAQELSDLRARYNPVFAATRQYRAALQDLNRLRDQGVISSQEYTVALEREADRMRMNVAASSAAAQQMSLASRGATLRMQQMFYQVNDIGVSLAGGMNPFVVMAQQGTQIAQIYGFGNGGVSGIFRDLGRMIMGVARASPVMTAGVLVAGAAIGGLTYEINQTTDVVVGLQDTALAVFQVIGSAIYDYIEPAVSKISEWFSIAWDAVVDGVRWTGNALINGTRVAVDGIATAVGTIPDLFLAGFNLALSHVQTKLHDMVWHVAQAVNGIAETLNETFGTSLSTDSMSGVISSLSEASGASYRAGQAATNRVAGAWDDFGDRTAGTWDEDPMGDFFDAVREQAIENARERQKKDEKGGKSGGRSSERDEVEELIRSLREELAVLRETDPVKRQMLEYSEQLADATAEERAQVLGLVEALDSARNGWEAVSRTVLEYAEEARRIGDDIGEAIVGGFRAGEDAVVDFVETGKLSFSDMVNSFITDLARLAARRFMMAPLADMLGGALGNLPGADSGMLAEVIASLSNFDGGGHTGYGARSGGLDGRGGFLAVMHPQERVIDETRQSSDRSDRVLAPVMNVYTRDAESFRKGRAQLAADAQRLLGYGRRTT